MSGRRKAAGLLEPELPITPMLDMSFQILFFFVMIYHPSALEVQLDLKLPVGPVVIDNLEPIPPPGPLADVTVVVGTQRDRMHHGGISHLVVQAPNGIE